MATCSGQDRWTRFCRMRTCLAICSILTCAFIILEQDTLTFSRIKILGSYMNVQKGTRQSDLPLGDHFSRINLINSTLFPSSNITNIGNLLNISHVDPVKRPVSVENFVTFGGGFADGRGLGNQLFDLATVVYVAELSGRKPAMLKFKYRTGLEEVFDLNLERFDDLCPCYNFHEGKSLTYDARIEDLARIDNKEIRNKSIVVWGFLQSWKYLRSIDRRLRGHLKFLPEVQTFVDNFLARTIPPSWIKGFIRVGIHVRRGDILAEGKVKFGYSTPNRTYFKNAMKYFINTYDRVQFIACSNDLKWTRENVDQNFYNSSSVNVSYSVGNSRGQDFAILSHCDHVIMSTGTYGWWAAWLAKGTTIYYKDWPIPNTELFNMFKREDFFPPNWIPMD